MLILMLEDAVPIAKAALLSGKALNMASRKLNAVNIVAYAL